MKKLNIYALILAAVLLSACHNHRHTTISTSAGNYKMRLEFAGDMLFNSERTKVEGLSDDGYIDYSRNGIDIYVYKNASGKICYERNGTLLTSLDTAGQDMLNEAIRLVVKNSR